MARAGEGSVMRGFGRLFGAGTVSGLTEGQLLARFVKTRDEAAFEALVSRFGPMVLGVCRQSLSDSHAADDAFQATFLVLVRRAGSIRDGDRLGNWLYGVAVKVAKRARADLARKRTREQEVAAVAAEIAGGNGQATDPDVGPLLHEEIARLPSKYREPIVLCFLDGRTHDEAAEVLGWPIGTVKGRLARAKDLLRDRLGRRGVTASTAMLAATLSKATEAAVPPLLLSQTVKAAMGIAAGGAVAAGLASAGALALSDGVIWTMTMTKWKLAAAGVIGLGLIASGASVYAQRGGDEQGEIGQTVPKLPVSKLGEPALEKTAVPPGTLPDAPGDKSSNLTEILKSEPKVGELPSSDVLAQKRLDAAEKQFEAMRAFYEHGTVTLDRYVAAIGTVISARMDIAADENAHLEVAEDEVRMLRSVVQREKAKYQNGTGALPNLREAELNLAESELRLSKLRQGPDVPAKDGKVGQVEENEEDLAIDAKINAALNKRISFPFAAETPLEDVIKYLKQETSTPGLPGGIPVYLNPIGLQEAEKTMATPIVLQLDNVKVRSGLRLILAQLDLGFFVREGFLTITFLHSPEFMDATLPGWRANQRMSPPIGGVGGGVLKGMGGSGNGAEGGFR